MIVNSTAEGGSDDNKGAHQSRGQAARPSVLQFCLCMAMTNRITPKAVTVTTKMAAWVKLLAQLSAARPKYRPGQLKQVSKQTFDTACCWSFGAVFPSGFPSRPMSLLAKVASGCGSEHNNIPLLNPVWCESRWTRCAFCELSNFMRNHQEQQLLVENFLFQHFGHVENVMWVSLWPVSSRGCAIIEIPANCQQVRSQGV